MAVKIRADLKSENASDFPDNIAGLISAADLRGQMDDTVDSALLREDIPGLDLSDAIVTATSGTQTLTEWMEDVSEGGIEGPPGPPGPPGSGLEVKGSAPTVEDLPLTAEPGDVWIVQEFDPDHLFMWDGDSWEDLGEGGGSSFIHKGPNAVERTMQDRLRDTVHLLDYIPTAEHAAILNLTSTYDASDAIDNAIAAFNVPLVGLGMIGPRLVLPVGKIRINRPINIRCSMTLEGSGASNTGDQGFGSVIEVAADQHGIITHLYNTYDTDKSAVAWSTPHLPWNNSSPVYAGKHVYTNDGGKMYGCTVTGITAASGGPTGTGSDIVDGTAHWAYRATMFIPGDIRLSTGAPGTDGIYECMGAGGALSTNKPTHQSGDVTYADGYTWRYMLPARASSGTNLKNFALTSLGGTTGHGIWIRSTTQCYDLYISNFPQNGYNIVATTGSGYYGALEGNCNRWRVLGGRVIGCQHGMYVQGSDANAGMALNADCSSNDGWGFYDISFLGNTYINAHTNGNGLAATRQYNRFTYMCINGALGPTTAPGTNPDVWWLSGTIGGSFAGDITDWTSGTTYVGGPLAAPPTGGSLVEAANGGVYRCTIAGGGTSTSQPTHPAGTAAYADGYSWVLQNAATIWVSGDTTIVGGGCFNMHVGIMFSCYAEAGQPARIETGFALLPGFGRDNLTNDSRGVWWTGVNAFNQLAVQQRDATDVAGQVHTFSMGSRGPSNTIFDYQHPVYQLQHLYDLVDPTDVSWRHGETSNIIRTETLSGTTVTFGRSAPVPYAFFPAKLFLNSAPAISTARALTMGAAIPTTGNWAAGDVMLNNAPLAGEPWGWRCILTGTPGTWQPLRDLGSQQTIATNAAFTLTPGTSPYHTLHTGTLTADRAVTLSTTGAFNGLAYKITRTGGGAFNLTVGTGPLKALATGQWCEVVFDGTAYYLSAYGTL